MELHSRDRGSDGRTKPRLREFAATRAAEVESEEELEGMLSEIESAVNKDVSTGLTGDSYDDLARSRVGLPWHRPRVLGSTRLRVHAAKYRGLEQAGRCAVEKHRQYAQDGSPTCGSGAVRDRVLYKCRLSLGNRDRAFLVAHALSTTIRQAALTRHGKGAMDVVDPCAAGHDLAGSGVL